MMGAFNRPIGAAADLKELEYISVLLQTQLPELRKNCTVSATDVSIFLHSRYGLNVSHEDAFDIVQVFGGHGSNAYRVVDDNHNIAAGLETTTERSSARVNWLKSDHILNTIADAPVDIPRKSSPQLSEAYLDIVQLASMLFIPTLLQAASMYINPQNGKGCDASHNANILLQPNDQPDTNGQSRQVAKKDEKQIRTSPKVFLDVLRFIIVWLSDFDEGVASLDLNDSDLELILTESRMSLILGLIGEEDLRSDTELVKAMIEHCATRNDQGDFVLNAESFAHAITSDVNLWNPDWIDRKSTFYFDVFGAAVGHLDDLIQRKGLPSSLIAQSQNSSSEHFSMKIKNGKYINVTTTDYSDFGVWLKIKQITSFMSSPLAIQQQGANHGEVNMAPDHSQPEQNSSQLGTASDQIDTNENESVQSREDIESSKNVGGEKRRWTFSQSNNTGFIDFIVDAQWSRLYLAFSWSFFVTSAVVYSILFSSRNTALQCNSDSYGCTLLKTIVAWFSTAIALCVCGVVVYIPISLANGPFRRTMKQAAISLLAVCVFTVVPFVGINFWMKGIPHGEEYSPVEKTATKFSFKIEIFVVLVSGSVLLCCIIILMLASAMYLSNGDFFSLLTSLVTTHDVTFSYYGKLAGTHKLDKLIANAHNLHFIKPSREATVRDTEKSAVLNYAVYGETEEICGGFRWAWRGLWTLDLFKKEGFWLHSRLFIGQLVQLFFGAWVSLILFDYTRDLTEQADTRRNELLSDSIDYPAWIYDFFPDGWMVKVSLYPAASIATCIMIFLFLFPFPCTASTVMKLRCGVIPSLQDPQFIKCRSAADTVAMNLGNSIFSIVGSGSFFFIFFGMIIFLSVWPYTRSYLLTVYAWLLGVFITIFLKTVLMMIFRIRHHRSLYRISQSSANITGLLLECWHIGVAPGFLINRLVQFLLASALWIGRIDVPFLSDDVCLFGYHFDNIPTHYRKDILAHEAHRHPYIERLGAMYMMRLKYGSHFGSRVGSCWRIVFVLYLMPWLRKHRVSYCEKLTDNRENLSESNVKEEDNTISSLTGNVLNAVNVISETVMLDYVPTKGPVVKVPDSSKVLESHS